MELKRLRLLFAALVLILAVAWLLSASAATHGSGFWATRGALVYLTGILAIGLMAVAVVLAARPVQIESLLGGLDKFYRLHRWLGIAAAGFGIAHWAIEVVPRWMVGWGWLERPPRRGAGAGGGGAAHPFAEVRDLGAEIGEWGFYLLLVLVVVALWRRIPYRTFLRTHRLMGLVFLMLAFHTVVLMPPGYWTAPVGVLVGVLMAGGAVAAVVSLVHRIGHRRRAVGTVESAKRYQHNAVLEVVVRLGTQWPGHHAGQFAFVTFHPHEGAHPFTIASAWQDDGCVTFEIKGLGDYTRALPDLVEAGQAVTVEGPYGRFDFEGPRARQIWIGGGIGITPFIARLQALADGQGDGRTDEPIDLIYSTQAPDEPFIENVRRQAEAAGVRFHLLVTPRDGLLTMDRLAEMVPAWREADVWFCGPEPFGRALREGITERGGSERRFHQEMFQMR